MTDHNVYWDSTELDTVDFLVLSGTESSVKHNHEREWFLHERNKRCLHLLAIKDESVPFNGTGFIHGQKVPQETDSGIDSWNRQVQILRNTNHLVIHGHPRWSRTPLEIMLAIQGCFAIEVWNTLSEYSETTGESEYEWDYCLKNGMRMFAVAADDSHYYSESIPDVFGGYVMVPCRELSRQGITAALRDGEFYASCGPEIKDMRVEAGVLIISCSPSQAVRLVSNIGFAPTLYAHKKPLTNLEWKIDMSLRYVRPEIIGLDGKKAWGQPIFMDDLS